MKEFLTITKYYKPYMKLFILDLIAASVTAAIALVNPMIIRHITGSLIYLPGAESVPQILKLGLIMIGLTVLAYGCERFSVYYGHLQGTYQERDMRLEIYEHLQELSFNYYDNAKVGALISRVTNDLFEITELLHHGPENILIYSIKVIGSFIILCTINWRLSLVALTMIIAMAIIIFFTNSKFTAAYTKRRAVMAQMSARIEDSLNGIRVVKSFTNESREIENFKKINEEYVGVKKMTYNYMSLYFASMHSMATLVTVVSVMVGSVMISGESLSIADLVAFILYIANFTDPICRLVDMVETFQNGYSGYIRFREIMNLKADITEAPDAVSIKERDGSVEFKDVSFKYSGTENNVLSHINLKINDGEYVAVCGPSGTGKTTLSSLIPRFYDVTDGEVLVGGVDVRKATLESLRGHIGIVQQDVYLFAGTIMENIKYGCPDASDEDVIKAAKAANAHSFIMSLPNGYDTEIGQRGVKLSGGQKQRVSIARVFLKNPPVLIFDEATSALDNESEKIVQESMETLVKGRTAIVIAHRLSTIKNAPRILVMSGDTIAEEGTHEELLNKGGIYAELYNSGK
ncbi:MAG: ABC transporter ATP-binding protein [Eubacteriales bacterium]|nr:ABC transporter ATP-binding protein [Eubacteriales bacterium]